MDEVRFDRMVPAQVRARRGECNLAYLPVGSLEWHGPHMPFGTDYLTVTHLAEESARRFGGVVFPPIYYGDVRYILQECRDEWRKTYAREMDVPEDYPAAFPLERGGGSTTQPDDGQPPEQALPFEREAQEEAFAKLVAATMLSIHLYGFRRILLLPGHGPNPRFCRQAEDIYRQNVLRRKTLGEPAQTETFFYIEAAKETEPLLRKIWIHADKWEGSITMVAAPGTVHLDQLPADPDALVPAYLGHPYVDEEKGLNPQHRDLWDCIHALDPRSGTTEEYGRAQIEGILSRFGEVIAEFMNERPN